MRCRTRLPGIMPFSKTRSAPTAAACFMSWAMVSARRSRAQTTRSSRRSTRSARCTTKAGARSARYAYGWACTPAPRKRATATMLPRLPLHAPSAWQRRDMEDKRCSPPLRRIASANRCRRGLRCATSACTSCAVLPKPRTSSSSSPRICRPPFLRCGSKMSLRRRPRHCSNWCAASSSAGRTRCNC